MQLSERVRHSAPVIRRFGWTAMDVGHDHQAVDEQPAVGGRDRYRNSQTLVVEVLEELGLPRKISIAAGPETTDRKLPPDSHAPDVVRDAASQAVEARDVGSPVPERLPSHRPIFASAHRMGARETVA